MSYLSLALEFHPYFWLNNWSSFLTSNLSWAVGPLLVDNDKLAASISCLGLMWQKKSSVSFVKLIEDHILMHNDRSDGTGYPWKDYLRRIINRTNREFFINWWFPVLTKWTLLLYIGAVFIQTHFKIIVHV